METPPENKILTFEKAENPERINKYIIQEEALKVLGEVGVNDPELVSGIAANDELANLIHNAHKNGRTFGTGFYFDLQRIDPALARKFAKRVDENGILPNLALTDAHIAAQGSTEEEVKAAHKISVLRGRFSFEGFREKTAEERLMIGRASEYANSVRAKFGLPPKKISEDLVTMVPHSAPSDRSSAFVPAQERVSVREGGQKLARLDHVQHEIFHASSFNVVKGGAGAGGVEYYRSGVSAVSQKVKNEKGNSVVLLDPLNEAITEELSRRGVVALGEDDLDFGDMVRERKQGLEDMEKVRARGNVLPPQEVLNEELLYARIDFDQKTIDQEFAGYSEERKAMWKLFGKVYGKDPVKFEGKTREEAVEELFEIASKAYFTGNLLPLGRMVNAAFGKDSFREYGHLQTPEEINQFLDTR